MHIPAPSVLDARHGGYVQPLIPPVVMPPPASASVSAPSKPGATAQAPPPAPAALSADSAVKPSLVDPNVIRIVSLGCFCGPKMSIKKAGHDVATLPFDWVRTRLEGLLHFLRTDFNSFFDYVVRLPVPGAGKMVMHRSCLHSFWHDDPTKEEEREKYRRRFERFWGMANLHGLRTILFVRAVATTDELPLIHELLAELKQRFGAKAKLLLILDFQTVEQEGPRLVEEHPNLLVYYLSSDVHVADNGGAPYAAAIQQCLPWALGLAFESKWPLPNLQVAASIAKPTHWGLNGLGGLRAFEDAGFGKAEGSPQGSVASPTSQPVSPASKTPAHEGQWPVGRSKMSCSVSPPPASRSTRSPTGSLIAPASAALRSSSVPLQQNSFVPPAPISPSAASRQPPPPLPFAVSPQPPIPIDPSQSSTAPATSSSGYRIPSWIPPPGAGSYAPPAATPKARDGTSTPIHGGAPLGSQLLPHEALGSGHVAGFSVVAPPPLPHEYSAGRMTPPVPPPSGASQAARPRSRPGSITRTPRALPPAPPQQCSFPGQASPLMPTGPPRSLHIPVRNLGSFQGMSGSIVCPSSPSPTSAMAGASIRCPPAQPRRTAPAAPIEGIQTFSHMMPHQAAAAVSDAGSLGPLVMGPPPRRPVVGTSACRSTTIEPTRGFNNNAGSLVVPVATMPGRLSGPSPREALPSSMPVRTYNTMQAGSINTGGGYAPLAGASSLAPPPVPAYQQGGWVLPTAPAVVAASAPLNNQTRYSLPLAFATQCRPAQVAIGT